MIRTLLICALSLLVLGGIGYFLLYHTPTTSVTTPSDTDARSEYVNDVHGFSVFYPASLDLLEYTDDIAAIGHLIEGGINSVADIRVITIEGVPGTSFTDTATQELANFCAADGPTESFSCTGVSRMAPFLSGTGDAGFEVYLTGELTQIPSGTKTTTEKGPFYVFLLSTSASASKIAVIYAPISNEVTQAGTETVRTIAEGFHTK